MCLAVPLQINEINGNEANSLSLFDVENILEYKQIIGKRDEIQEVKNIIDTYNKINNYDYKSEKDFIETHGIMMKYFDEDNDNYRNHGEGVEKEDTIILKISIIIDNQFAKQRQR